MTHLSLEVLSIYDIWNTGPIPVETQQRQRIYMGTNTADFYRRIFIAPIFLMEYVFLINQKTH